MQRVVIVVGDHTTGGGEVLTGAPSTFINNIAIARVGDKASCPKHVGFFAIVTGDDTFLIDGQSLARHGERLPTADNRGGGTPGHGRHRGRGKETRAVSRLGRGNFPSTELQPSVGSALHDAAPLNPPADGRS